MTMLMHTAMMALIMIHDDDDNVSDDQLALMIRFRRTTCINFGNISSYGSKVDMWSAGVVCYQMLCGLLPFTW